MGIAELILSIITFNFVLFIWAIVTTLIAVFLIGKKLEQIDEKESDKKEKDGHR